MELEERIVALRRELGEQHAVVRAAKSESSLQTARLTQAVTERDGLAKSLRNANETLATKVPQLERELSETATRLASVESTLIDRDRAIDQQRAEIRRLETRLQSAEVRGEALENAVSSDQIRAEKDASVIAKLERQVRLGAATLATRDTEVTRLSESLRRAQSERDELNRSSEELRTRLAKISAALATAEQSLQRQSQQIAAGKAENERLAENLKTIRAERDTATETSGRIEKQASATSARLSANESELQRVTASLNEVQGERDKLASEAEAFRTQMANSAAAVAEFQRNLEARSAALANQKAEITRLTNALRAAETQQVDQASLLEDERTASQNQLSEIRSQLDGMVSQLAEKEAELAKGVAQRDELHATIAESQRNLSAQEAKIARLTRHTEAAQAEVMRLHTVLSASDKNSKGLQRKLAAVAAGPASGANFDDLMKFRSEFFGRLSSVLGDRDDIRVDGDRFVFQAEVLFDSGSAELGRVGRDQLTKVATTLKDISRSSPQSLNWILRVDGHTDRLPIQTNAFPSNWELSAARAISVVRFLIAQGVPADRLSANGFGEHQPLDDVRDLRAYRRNRRIELKLTNR